MGHAERMDRKMEGIMDSAAGYLVAVLRKPHPPPRSEAKDIKEEGERRCGSRGLKHMGMCDTHHSWQESALGMLEAEPAGHGKQVSDRASR